MQYSLLTPEEVSKNLAARLKKIRLNRKWKRSTLAKRSGVTGASLKRFEQTGEVSMKNFLKLAFTIGRLDEVDKLLCQSTVQSIKELEQREKKIPKRGSV
ncbi:MAG: hypothetical protein K8S18_07895 [Desulfobacula sp.]|nr:hypothetical protein [Desulfobacula sp.]